MTRNIDHRRLGRLRQDQGEIANHIIDEFAAGRLSRRDFVRRATVVGISVPALPRPAKDQVASDWSHRHVRNVTPAAWAVSSA